MRLVFNTFAALSLVFVGSSSIVLAQEDAVPQSTLDYYISNYAQKGILIEASEIQNLNQDDLIRIENFNFDTYRRLNNDQLIVLDNHQKVILKSLNFLIDKGISIDESLLSLKSDEVDESALIQPVVKVTVSLGFQKVDSKEKWEAK